MSTTTTERKVEKMRAYKKISKRRFVAEMVKHRKQDTFIQGEYWDLDTGRGCMVGCAAESLNAINGHNVSHNDHEMVAHLLGIPSQLVHAGDSIFEKLNADKAGKFAVRFCKAIPSRKDLSLVWPKFAVWMLRTYSVPNVLLLAEMRVINNMIKLFDLTIKGEVIQRKEWRISGSDRFYDMITSVSDGSFAGSAVTELVRRVKDYYSTPAIYFRTWNEVSEKLTELMKETN